MTYWKEWGAYLSCLIESGGSVGNTPVYNRVENDFINPTCQNGWGGGLGLIQFTSNAFQLMQAIIANGVSTSPIAGTQYLSDLQNNTNGAYYNQSWINMPNAIGPFTDWTLVSGIKTMLDDPLAHEVQDDYIVVYFDQTNGSYVDMIANSGLNDEVKSFLMTVVVLSPGWIPTLLAPPVSTTLQGMANDYIATVGSGYVGRVNTILSYYTPTIDFTSPPPYDFWNTATNIPPGSPGTVTPPGKPSVTNPSEPRQQCSDEGYYLLLGESGEFNTYLFCE